MAVSVSVRIAQHEEADALLEHSPLAVLVSTVLEWQVPPQRAFGAPAVIARRLGRADLDTRVLAEHDPGRLAALFAAPPAVHHCPQLMARQVQDLCRCLVARHGGQATAVWEGAENGRELLRRIKQLPGFGKQKSQILVALLGKRFGVCPPGWREAAGVYGEDGVFRSVADITGPESLDKVCTWQQETHRAEAAARRPAPRARYAHG